MIKKKLILYNSKSLYMIWFNLKKAETLLKKGDYSNAFVLKYFMINLVVTTLATFFYDESPQNWFFLFELVFLLGVTIIGTLNIYFINEKGDHKDFLPRYFVLGFIVSLRVILIWVLPLALLFVSTKNFIPNNFEAFERHIDLSFEILATIIFYYLLAKSFKRVAN